MSEQHEVNIVRIFSSAIVVNLVILFVVTVPTDLGTPVQWFVAAGLGLGIAGALLCHEVTRSGMKEREVRSLRRAVDRSQGQWFKLQLRWLGRQVRLTEDLWWLDDASEREYTIPAGTVGWITGLNMNSRRPFYVRFPDISERVLVSPTMMEIDPLPAAAEPAQELV